jgi:hypothetical protein
MSGGHRPNYGHSSLLRRRYVFPPASPALIGIREFSFHDPFGVVSFHGFECLGRRPCLQKTPQMTTGSVNCVGSAL